MKLLYTWKAVRKFLAFLLVFNGLALGMGFAQQVFSGRVPGDFTPPVLEDIETFEVYQLDLDALYTHVRQSGTNIPLVFEFGDKTLPVTLHHRPNRREDVVSLVMTEQGIQSLPPRPGILYRVETDHPGEGTWLFAINQGFFGGAFVYDHEQYAVEPLWHHAPGYPEDLVIVYKTSLARFLHNPICGTDPELHKCTDHDQEGEDHQSEEEDLRFMGCKEVEYASALDWSFVNKYNGVNGAWNRVDLVMGLVEGQYTGYFNNDYIYIRTHEFASNCSSCDPSQWTNTTNSSTLLSNFRSWGNGGGFGNTAYDVAGLWTNRVFQSGVVGIAYVGGLCNSFKYHCLMDFSSQNWAMRVMVAHELGHNFNCQHDGGNGFIMSPSVNNTTNWSSGSISTINNFTAGNSGSCMTNCVPQSPPVAEFSGNPTQGCKTLSVQFTDQSTGGATSWSWSFPGGSPATSNLQNPSVSYSVKGTFNVTLTASNAAGSNTITKTEYITVLDKPICFWDEVADENIVSFIDLSDDAITYFWEFGDGDTSTDPNPVHVYPGDGVYLARLTVTNTCGSDTYSKFLTIVTTPNADFASDVIKGCSPLTVSFEDQSSPNTTNWAWSFPGANPDTSNVKNPVVVYNTPGVYTVTLTASNSAGSDTKVKANYITVIGLPNGTFSYTQKIDSVFFTALGNPDSVIWNFGDGNSSMQFNPVHVYAQEGVYTVTLTAFNECGQGTASQEVTIVFPPQAGFNVTPQQGCAPLTVNFEQAASPNTTSFQWFFPGGVPSESTDADPAVTYPNPGQYSVTMIAINAAGSDTLVAANAILVLSEPTAAFTADVQNGNEVTFTNNSQYGVNFEWSFGDGATSNESDPVHIYTQEGDFTVTLTVTNECGTSTFQQIVSVLLPPQAGFSSNKTTGCAPLTIQFIDQSSPSTTAWAWSFEGGDPANSGDQNPVVVFAQPGNYTVTLTVTNPVGSGTLEIQDYIQVLGPPVADFTSANNNGTVSFSNKSQYGQSYEWTFGDGAGSNEENPQHTYQDEGPFVVTLTVTNECGVNTYSEVINVIFAPRAGFGADNRQDCGETMTVQFFDQSEGQADSWAWTFEGGVPTTSDLQNPIVTYSVPGTYDVQLIATGPGGSDTLRLTDYVVLASETPLAKFSMEDEGLKVTFTSLAERTNSWFWDFGDGSTSTEEDPVHVYAANGLYQVTLIVTNPCGADTLVQSIQVTATSAELPLHLQSLRILPNPSTGVFILELRGEPRGEMSFDVIDVLGRIVHADRIPQQTSLHRQEVVLRNLPQGTYFLRLWHEGRAYPSMIQILY